MAQITINIQTMDWTMGETVGLHLMLKKGSKARIAWGDGKVQVVTGKQKPASEKLAWVEAGHSYPEKGMYYTITICSEEEDAIIGFNGCGMFEVKTFDVILTECPNLRILGYSGYGEEKLDVSKNPLLEFIDFHEIRNEKLDFSVNPLLEELHIDGAKDLVSLNLSKNDKLRRLDIFMCHNLQHLALSNQSQLNEVDFALTHLRPKDLEYLEKTLKRNSPYKIRGGSFGDDKIIEVSNGEIVGEDEGKLDSTYRYN